MNTDSLTPGPHCDEYAALLPLLNTDELDADEAASLRAHLADCRWCQQQAREYALVDAAVRRYVNKLAAPAPVLSLEAVIGRPGVHVPTPAPAPSAPLERRPSRTRHLAAWFAPVAAVLIIVIITVALFSSRNHLTGKPAMVISIFDMPGHIHPDSITTGPDGNLWFLEIFHDNIGRLTPGGKITIFVPLPENSFDYTNTITAGPDGNLWLTENGYGGVWRVTPNGQITKVILFTDDTGRPTGITAGPDRALWFADTDNYIGRITPEGLVTEFPIPTPDSRPEKIITGPDGNLWFTEVDANKIGRIIPGGSMTEFTLPTPHSAPWGITSGPDGNLWFTEKDTNKIGRITPQGHITEFAIPSQGLPKEEILNITAGPDGNLWFTDFGGRIGRITPEGHIDTYLTGAMEPWDITPGPDGNLWFTVPLSSKIGRVTIRR